MRSRRGSTMVLEDKGEVRRVTSAGKGEEGAVRAGERRIRYGEGRGREKKVRRG